MERNSKRFLVTRNGRLKHSADTHNECLTWLHREVSYSWHHAMTVEGWAIVDQLEALKGEKG